MIGAVCFWFQSEYVREHQLSKRITEHGGTVVVERQVPDWIKWLISPAYFDRITEVNWLPIDSVDPRELRGLPSLRRISLAVPGAKLTKIS